MKGDTAMAVPLNSGTLAGLPASVTVPSYNRAGLIPAILHVGVGNFHRAHMAHYLDRLFAMGEGQAWALRGAGVRAGDAAMRDRLAKQDWLTTVVELDPGALSARVLGSMVDFVPVDPAATVAAPTRAPRTSGDLRPIDRAVLSTRLAELSARWGY